jgi:sigma-B regulation protein RsbU (phosphoserine phosphatase)
MQRPLPDSDPPPAPGPAMPAEPERLALDFTTSVCLDHYTADQRRALEDDLELAARVQQQLFPCCVPALPGVQVAAHAHPARILSGDYYDFFFLGEQVQGMVIADVMGKGVAAAMLMASLQASLRILGPEAAALDALAARLNALFRDTVKLIRFITLCLVALDAETGVLRYVNAGHNPPLLWDAARRTVRWLKPTGPALGLLPSPTYRTEAVQLHPGDVVVLYTDGLVEARDAAGEGFGEERLADYVRRHTDAPADRLLAGLRQAAARFAGGHLHDDVALLVVTKG